MGPMPKSLIILVTAMLLTSPSAFTQSGDDPMQAHSFQSTGPWFEGWYTRITDFKTGVSMAVITTSALHQDQTLVNGQPPGYVSIVVSTPASAKTLSFEAYPKATSLKSQGTDFRWAANGFGLSSKAWTDVAVPGGARIQMKMKTRKRWSAFQDEAGPESILGSLPFIPLHWFVFNTNGAADYALDYTLNGKIVHIEGSGFVHQEKNWGKTFPQSWIWAQATSDDGSSYVALAGGDLSVGPLTAHSYMVGYRSQGVHEDFKLGQGLTTGFANAVNGCGRKFKLEAANDGYLLKLEAAADPQSFAELSIPTATGYRPRGAIESFTAVIRTKLFKKTGSWYFPNYQLVETKEFRQAALEFGAAAMGCRQ